MTAEPALARLGRFAAEARWQDVPTAVRDLARLQLGSVLASYATGARSDAASRISRGLGVAWDPARLLPLPPAGDADSLVGALAAASMAHDFDDYLFLGHTGHSAVGAALALSNGLSEDEAGGEELLTRIVVGNEIGGRLGASMFFGPLNGQLWGPIHLVIAAAIQGRALGLPAEGIAHALAIALAQPPFPLPAGFMGAPTKLLTASVPAMQGMRAARLAAAGLQGNLSVLSDPRGFWDTFSFAPLPEVMTGLGRTWLTETISFKRWPGCAYLGPILDSLADLRGARELPAEQVRQVDVEASFLTVEMDEMARPWRERRADLDPVLVNFSVADTVALDLLAGGVRCADLEPAALAARRDAVRSLAPRVRLHHAWDLSVDLLRSVNRSVPLGELLAGLPLAEVRRQARRHHGKTLDLGATALRRIVRQLSPREARSLARFLGGHALRRPPRRRAFDLSSVSFVSFELPVGARVTVTLRDGTKHARAVRRPLGSPQTPREDVVREKLQRDVGGVLGAAVATRIQELVAGLPSSFPLLQAEVLGSTASTHGAPVTGSGAGWR